MVYLFFLLCTTGSLLGLKKSAAKTFLGQSFGQRVRLDKGSHGKIPGAMSNVLGHVRGVPKHLLILHAFEAPRRQIIVAWVLVPILPPIPNVPSVGVLVQVITLTRGLSVRKTPIFRQLPHRASLEIIATS